MKHAFESIIGLEIHLQLKTNSKMFCSCLVVPFDSEPNSSVCPVCLGHPGTLPVVNREAVRQGIRMALALHGRILKETRFDRKSYFYPDLPKGYQISQFDEPLSVGGFVELFVKGKEKRYHLERLHLEEDAGKNFHSGNESMVDFNRAGVPLAEIVTKPDFRSAEDARAFLQELRLIARYLGASDADMEKGQLRCDANISVRPVGNETLFAKTEIKNLNSFRAVERALHYEIGRQTRLWEQGDPPHREETRGWDEPRGETYVQRIKEGSDEYRYFPEPDLKPILISEEDIQELTRSLPELPRAKRIRFIEEYEVTREAAQVLVADKPAADYFEAVVEELKNWLYDSGGEGSGLPANRLTAQGVWQAGTREEIWEQNRKKLTKLAYSWITSELFKHLNADGKSISEISLTPENFAEFIVLVYQAKVNSSAAQTVLEKMYHEGKDPSDIAEDEGLFQTSSTDDLAPLVRQALAENPEQVEQYRAGKQTVLQFLIGKVMKLSKGSADPKVVADLLKKVLNK
ncbi:MAG: Asp-tRNA(Asn)/Glu-tRNA(Gln) amidotransferase subunit GatB [Candidatus Komeilibacteria bacterium]|nr:Asp-tRNA(Asn)/Glu-tRNA(Gln) amidotransferase subunit GatB [Candidatus Komeilibacteria bacterium]